MSLTIIAVVIILGLLLIVTEVFLVPGSTIVGIIGLVVLGVGVYYSFKEYGITMGASILLGSAVIIGLLTSIGIKRMSKGKFSVHTKIDSKVNDYNYSNIKVGDSGMTLTALRPEGRALINDERIIVYSKGFYIDNDIAISVVSIKDNKVIVEQKI